MSIARTIAKNSMVILAGSLLERLISFFIGLILIRYLGSTDFGKYSLIYAFLSLFQIFTNMGIDPIVLRELSRDFKKGEEFFCSAISLRLLFSLTGIFLCWVILQWMHYPIDIKMLIYLASLSMVFSFGMLFNNIFQAKLLMQYPTIIGIAMKILFAVFTFILIYFKATIFYFILLNLLTYTFSVFLIYYQARRFLRIRLECNLIIWKELLKNSLPLAASTIFASIYTRIDQVMLFHMRGKEELGFYAASVKLAELPIMFAGVFMASVIPLLSKYAKDSPELFKKIYQISFRYLMMFIIPIATMVMFYSKQIILVSYGRSFVASGVSLAILIWSTVFVYIGLVHSNLLVATNLQYLDILFTGSSVVINIVLNLILIPKYGFSGAAIATTISYGFGVPLSYLLKKTRIFGKAIFKSILKPLLIALPVGYLIYSIPYLHVILKFIITGFTYLVLILLLKGIDSQDLKYFKELFPKIHDF